MRVKETTSDEFELARTLLLQLNHLQTAIAFEPLAQELAFKWIQTKTVAFQEFPFETSCEL